MLLAPLLINVAAMAQTQPPPPGANLGFDDNGSNLTSGAQQTQATTPASPYVDAKGQTTLIQQAAEQNTQEAITNTNNQLLQGSELAQYNDTYAGMKAFWGDDMVSNFFANIGQVIGRWVTEFINGWISDAVQFLTAFLRTFVLNPNIAVNGLNTNPNGANGSNKNDDISPYIRQGADTMYGIAVDLLLLLFILCIWKYWADAAWRGGAGLMGSVGRLIFTAGLLLAWPTIYAFEIQITNEMIKAIYFNSADQVMMLDAAMAAAVKGGLVATAGLLANTFAPVLGSVVGGVAGAGAGGMVLGTVGGIVSFVGLIIYLILGGILIAELIYILVLKAIQTALLTAQYMFAPIFIVFFATPDTESVCSGFVRSFVEVSLWTFVWVGLLKIMVIILFSDFNPWGKIVMAVGVLQLMIQTPSFMARAQISPMSDFISAGLLTGGLMKGIGALGTMAQNRTAQLFKYNLSDKFAARGLEQSQKVGLDKLPTQSANPGLSKNLQDPSNATGQMLGKDGKPIVPAPPGGLKKGPQPPGANKPGDPNAKAPEQGKDLKNPQKPTDPNAATTPKPGPKPPGATKPVTTPTTPTGDKTLQNPGTGGETAGQRLANAAKLTGGIAAGAAVVSALGANAGQRDAQSQSEEARKQDEARKASEAILNATRPTATPPGDKEKGQLSEQDKKAQANAAAQELLKNGNKNLNQNKGDDKKGGPDANGAGGKAETLVTAGAPKPGPKRPSAPTAAPITPIKPGDLNKPGEDEAKKAAERAGGNQTAQNLHVGNSEHEHEQDGKDGEKGGAGANVKQGVTVRPVLPTAAGPKPPVGGQGGGVTKGGGGGSGGGNASDKGTVTPELKQGTPLTGNKPALPTDLKPGTPVIGADGKPVVAHGTVNGTGVPNDVEIPGSEDQMVQGFDANGRPVMIRVNSRPGATPLGNRTQNVQGIVQQGPGGSAAAPTPIQTALHMLRPATALATTAAVTGAASHILSQSLSSSAQTHGRNIDPSTAHIPDQLQDGGGDAPPPPNGGVPVRPDSPFDKFKQSNYRWVPPRGLAIDIRTAAGPTMGPSTDGRATIVGNGRGQVNHVRFGANATPEQKAMQLMAAGYAQTFATDSEAFDAAREAAIDANEDGPRGMFERAAAGFMAYNGGSFKQTAVAKQRFQKSLLKHAVLGSEAYVNGQEGNQFTEYLKGRYGEMTPDQQAWGIHIMTDDSSPESGWNPRVGPATDTLVQAGMPITAANRAAASNTAVLKQPAWGRGPAIRGVASYVNSIVSAKTGPDTHAMVRDAMIGREAPAVGAAEVGACLAIMLESPTVEAGEAACSDTNMVQTVARLVAGGHQKDYASAYRSLSGMVHQLGGGGGGGGRGTAQTLTMAAPPPSGGGGGGPMSIGNFGMAGGGGGGGVQNNVADVNLVDQGGGAGGALGSLGNIPLPSMNPPIRTQTDLNFRNAAGNNLGTNRQQIDMPVTSTPGSQEFRMAGNNAGPVPIQRTELDVNARLVNSGNGGLGNIPINQIPANQAQARQIVDVNIKDGGVAGNGGYSSQSVNVDVPTNFSSSNPDVRISGGGGTNETLTNHQYVEAYGNGGGNAGYQDNSSDMAAVAQQTAASMRNNVHTAQQIIMDMHAAGFTDDQIQDPRIAAAALDVYQKDASMMGTASITARIMGGGEFSHGSTQVVQSMIDNGWSSNRISRPDVYTAQSIMQSGGTPTPQYVQAVRMIPEYNPRPNAQLPPNIAAEAARSRAMGQFEDFVRSLGGGRNNY